MITGVDISHSQGTTKKQINSYLHKGVEFFIHKATEGNDYTDYGYAPFSKVIVPHLNTVGVASYHWLLGRTSKNNRSSHQARHYINTLKNSPLGTQQGMFVDLERGGKLDSPKPQWRDMLEFSAEFHDILGDHTLGWYFNAGSIGNLNAQFNANIPPDWLVQLGYPDVWYAEWMPRHNVNFRVNIGGFHGKAVVWQFDTGSGGGNYGQAINGSDVDLFDGTVADFRTKLYGGSSNPLPCPTGQHRDATGVCVDDPPVPVDPWGEPWFTSGGDVSNINPVVATTGAGVGILIGAAAIAGIAALAYIALQANKKKGHVLPQQHPASA